MSLPASQQRVLDTIESVLKRREPRLASMFAIFTRLTVGEGLPRTEMLERVAWWSPRRYAARVSVRAAVVISMAVVFVVSAVFLGMSQSRLGCTPMPFRTPLTAQQAHTRMCPAAPQAKGYAHGP
jgi:hypothetical protein